MVRRVAVRILGVALLIAVCAPVAARPAGCDEVATAWAAGLTDAEIIATLRTTTATIRACEHAAAIRDRVAQHRARADAYRAELQRRFNP